MMQALLLLAKVHKGSNNLNAATETQMHARTTQTSLLAKVRAPGEVALGTGMPPSVLLVCCWHWI